MPLAGWDYSVPIPVDNTGSSSALSYYQLPITVSGAAYTKWAAHGKADGSDIRILDSDGTVLKYCRERIDSANSTLYLLAKVPRVAAGASRTLELIYGNPNAPDVSSYATTVGPTSAITGPTDIAAQASYAGYNAWPMQVILRYQTGGNASKNGNSLVFFSNGTSHLSADRKLVMLTSTDGGVSYTGTDLLTPTAGNNAEPLAIGEATDGTIYLCYTYDTTASRQAATCKHYVAKSTDGGSTWTNLSRTPSNQLTLPWTVGTDAGLAYGRIYQDASGNLLLPVYGKPSAAARSSQFLQRCPSASDPTNGSNWTNYATIAAAGASGSWAEAALCLVQSSSKWLAIMRDEAQTGDLYAALSTDSTGSSWGSPARINMPSVSVGNNAVSPDLLRLSSGNILLSFGMRQGSALWGSAHVVSTDDGTSWIDRPAYAPMSDAATTYSRNYGYPSAQQRSDGQIVAVGYHEAGGNDLTNVRRVIMGEDNVVNGNNVYADCETFAASIWPAGTIGANVSLDAGRFMSGTQSIKIDNSAGTGQNITGLFWPTGTNGNAARKVALSVWMNASQIASNAGMAFAFQDTTPNFRANGSAIGSDLSFGWYNGSAYTMTAAGYFPINAWVKMTDVIDIQASSAAGKILKNNSDSGLSQGQYGSGTNPDRARFSVGNVSGITASTGWFDSVYSHQYAATLPTVTVGSEVYVGGGAAAMIGGF